MDKRAIIYCRVSTRSQADEGTSLDSQAEACEKKARELGYRIERVTKETYTGADLFERPLLNKDRADIRAGQIDALIIYAIDRLSRNIAHLAIVDEECRKARCELIFVQEDIDHSPEGKLLLSVRGYVAEVERLKIRERSMRGRRAKILNGIPVLSSTTLYGYTADRENRRYLINEPEAGIVRRIFDLAEKGFGSCSIVRKLNEENLPAHKGGIWSMSSVVKILTNEAYAGETYANKYKRVNDRSIKRPRSEWVRLPDSTRPAIITPAQWERVNRNRVYNRGNAMRNYKKPLLLRGLVYCDICGAKMYSTIKKDKGRSVAYIRYKCPRKTMVDAKNCSNSSPYELKLNRIVITWLKEFLARPDALDLYREVCKQAKPEIDIDSEIEIARKLLLKTDRGLQRLLTSFRNADDSLAIAIEKEIYHAQYEKQALEKTLQTLKAKQVKDEVTAMDFNSFQNNIAFLRENIDSLSVPDLHDAVEALGVKVFVNGNEYRTEIRPLI